MSEQTTPSLATKIVVDANLEVFVAELLAAAQDGWTLNAAHPVGQYGYLYEAHMVKDTSLIDATPTRADILANARSAKKLKAQAVEAEEK